MVIHCTFNTNDIFVRVDFKTSSVREGRLEMAYIAFLHDVSASVLVSRANPLGIETTRDLLALRTKCLVFRFQWLTHLKKKKRNVCKQISSLLFRTERLIWPLVT